MIYAKGIFHKVARLTCEIAVDPIENQLKKNTTLKIRSGEQSKPGSSHSERPADAEGAQKRNMKANGECPTGWKKLKL